MYKSHGLVKNWNAGSKIHIYFWHKQLGTMKIWNSVGEELIWKMKPQEMAMQSVHHTCIWQWLVKLCAGSDRMLMAPHIPSLFSWTRESEWCFWNFVIGCCFISQRALALLQLPCFDRCRQITEMHIILNLTLKCIRILSAFHGQILLPLFMLNSDIALKWILLVWWVCLPLASVAAEEELHSWQYQYLPL